jgi:type IV pilus assembly protein PilN
VIRVNLLPVKELKAEVTRRRDLTTAGTAVGVTIVLLGALYLHQAHQMTTLQREMTDLRGEIQTLNLKVKEVGELQAKIKEYNSKYGIIEDLRKRKIGPVRVMESLARAAPVSLSQSLFQNLFLASRLLMRRI